MTWSPGPVVTRRRLGGELRRLREGLGLKLEDVARSLECSPSKISRLENGKGVPRWRDVRDMLDVYDVADGDERERLLDWARTGRTPRWWSAYADVLPPGLDTYVELEWDASEIHAYESHVVHGLLQTPEYARGVLEGAWGASYSKSQIERMVEVRLKRQEALSASHGLTFHCVLDESTLYRVVTSPDVLRTQIEHLIEAAEAEQVDVRVLPFSAGLVAANLGSFAKLEFAEGIELGLVHVERPGGAEFLADPAEIALHEARLATVLGAALSETESIPLMRRAAKRVTEDW
jgi:transcriptional regulator with XRE-family HTH domain